MVKCVWLNGITDRKIEGKIIRKYTNLRRFDISKNFAFYAEYSIVRRFNLFVRYFYGILA